MKILDLNCPHCGAALHFDDADTRKTAFCEYCGTKLLLDDEVRRTRIDDAEQFGYDFEKGRQRAQAEHARETPPRSTYTPPYSTYTPPRQAAPVGKGKPKNKATALVLCIFFGYFGAHKFYEGKTGMGILYIFTFGLFYFGWIIDIFKLLAKPSTYYVE